MLRVWIYHDESMQNFFNTLLSLIGSLIEGSLEYGVQNTRTFHSRFETIEWGFRIELNVLHVKNIFWCGPNWQFPPLNHSSESTS